MKLQVYNSPGDQLINLSKYDDGVFTNLHLLVHTDLDDAVRWVTEYRAKLDAEHKLRSENPELKFLWDQYQTYLNMMTESK